MRTFEDYIKEVKEQLVHNMSRENMLAGHISYNFTDAQIDANLIHFEQCKICGLSAYKALLYFCDYLEDFKIQTPASK